MNFHWMKRHSFEIQFWGYETGNVIASITGHRWCQGVF